MPNKRLILLDGHALAYRAFYALPFDAFSTREGEPTNAVYGFAATLLSILQEHRPDYLAVCFDAGHSGREEIYAEYKGQRERMPSEMAMQMDRVRQVIETFDIPIFEQPGLEADDLLGALARKAVEQGVETLIVTGDRDLLQLVEPHVRVFLSGRRLSEGQIYDEEGVRERYGGLSPAQLRDYKALIGDKSDNIPGVRGVGEKTATRLLKKYGSLEAIYEHLDEVKQTRFRNALEKGRDLAFLSQKLTTLLSDVDVELDLEACRIRTYDRSQVLDLFRELEFRSLVDRLPEPEATPHQLLLFGEAVEDVESPSSTLYHVVTEEEQLEQLVEQLSEASAITFDVETTSVDPMQARLTGLALTDHEGEGWYIPVGHCDEQGVYLPSQLPLEQVLGMLRPLLEDPRLPKQAHNAKYDLEVLSRYNVQVQGLAFDTMLAEWLIDPGSRNLGLKNLCFIRLGIEMTPIEDLIGSGRSQITMDRVPVEEAAAYAAADVDITHRLVRVLEPELREKEHWDLFVRYELPLVPVLMAMEMTGVALDVDYLQHMSEELGERIGELDREIQRMVGYEINVNSSQQLAEALFTTLELPTQNVARTSTGRYSVAASVLEELKGKHPIIEYILEYRELAKLQSTYVDALPALINAETGRVHTSYNQTGTVTGRISSSGPNLQNIPVRTPLGRRVRRAFIARPGWLLLAADYSQVELRVLAHISGDPGLLSAFRRGEDIHTTTAAAIFDVGLDQVSTDQRQFAKSINFGVVYGMSAYSLARSTGLTLAEAENFIAQYFERFPGVRRYLTRTVSKAKTEGYVETLLERRRYFPVLQSTSRGQDQARRRAEREAVNAPIQGSAADIINVAMLQLHRALNERQLQAQMIIQVHDELILEVPRDELERVAPLVCEIMESAYALDAPLKVDLKVGQNWEEMEPLEV